EDLSIAGCDTYFTIDDRSPGKSLKDEGVLRVEELAAALLRTEDIIITTTKNFSFVAASELFHSGIEVDDTQGVIDGQDTIGAMLEDSGQTLLFFDKRASFEL